MKILFASFNHHMPEGFSGVSVTMHTMAQALLRRGHRVALVVGSRTGGAERPPPDRSLGYPVFRCGTADAIARVIAISPFDQLIWHCNEAPPMTRQTALRAPRAIAYLQNARFRPDYRACIDWGGFTWIANSRYTADCFAAEFGVRPSVLNQPVAAADYKVSSAATHVLFVNPDERKGVEIALQLAETFPTIPFRFQESWLLPPASTAALRERAARCPNIEWLGGSADMRAAFAVARLLLMPSRWPEAWGRTASEAQVSGIPVLASRVGGLPEAVGPGGILIDPEAPIEAWAGALAQLWNDKSGHAALSSAARVYAARPEVNPDRVIDRLLDHMRAHK